MKILIVEDEPSLREIMYRALVQEHYVVETAATYAEADAKVAGYSYDCILLDIMLPGEDGISILRRLRSLPDTAALPVILLTAKNTEYDKVIGLDSGADDYIAKPFGMMELISRVNALLRRANRPAQGAAEEIAEPSDLMVVGAIKLSPSARTVMADGREVNLTRKEFDLLRTLMENKGRVLTREQLLEQVWGVSFVGETRTVDMHIRTLRQKLGAYGEKIETVRGVGYRMEGKA